MSASNRVRTDLGRLLLLCESSDVKQVETVPVKVHFTMMLPGTSFFL